MGRAPKVAWQGITRETQVELRVVVDEVRQVAVLEQRGPDALGVDGWHLTKSQHALEAAVLGMARTFLSGEASEVSP